jgi:hypothetical protein
MARIPILQGPGQIQTGNQTLRVPELQAVNNQGIAQGLAKVGQVAFDISERAKRAQDVTNLTNASMAMQNAQLEFAKFQQENPDESAWMGKWDELQTKLKTDFDKMPLTPDARLQLQYRVTNWSTRGTIMVQAEAFKQTGKRTAQAFENAVTLGKQSGNFDIAETTVKDIDALPLPKETKDGFRIALDVAKKETLEKKEYDSLLSMASPGPTSDPKMASELAWEKAKSGVISPLQATNIAEQAKQTEAVNRRDAIMFYKQKMETGGKVSAEELMNDWRLGDMDRTALAQLQDGQKNSPVEFEQALTTVMNFDRSQYADDKAAVTELANLEANLEARFDGAYLSNLKTELNKRSGGLSPEDAEKDIGPALKFLDQEIENGALGPVTRPVLKDGKPVMREPKEIGFVESPGWFGMTSKKKVEENAGENVPLTEPDPVAREAAAAVQREIRTTLNNEVKSGKIKTQGEIYARAIDLFKMKGGKPAPVNEQSTGPNPLLPGLNQPRKELDQLLRDNGY